MVETHPDQVHICPTCGRNYPGESWSIRPILTRFTSAPPVAGTTQVRLKGNMQKIPEVTVYLTGLTFDLKVPYRYEYTI